MSNPKARPLPTADQMAPTNAQGRQRNDVRRYSGDKVTIVSKLPMALMLQHEEWREEQRQDRQTRWTERVSYRVGPVVVIAGTAFPNGEVPEGMVRPQMVGGFAFTPNVDREFWEKWVDQHPDYPPLKNGLIYAADSDADAKAYAKEHRDLDSGLGPVQHAKNAQGEDILVDPRIPKKISSTEAARARAAEAAAE